MARRRRSSLARVRNLGRPFVGAGPPDFPSRFHGIGRRATGKGRIPALERQLVKPVFLVIPPHDGAGLVCVRDYIKELPRIPCCACCYSWLLALGGGLGRHYNGGLIL